MNLGGDGGERTSVKVHHAPGGGGSLNLFGDNDYSAPTISHSKASYGYTPPPPAFGGRVPLKESPISYNAGPAPTYADQYAPKYGAYEAPASRVPDSYSSTAFTMGPSFVPTHSHKSKEYTPPSGYGHFTAAPTAPSYPSAHSYEGPSTYIEPVHM